MMEEAGQEALWIAGNMLAERTRPDIPVGDPELDPDPSYSLANNIKVRVYGRYVSVSVEGPYAVKQHEAMHFKHPRGGHAKFLESNAIMMADELQNILVGTVQKVFTARRMRGARVRTTSVQKGSKV